MSEDLKVRMSIKTNIQDQIATVTLNRPEVHNALSPEMINELTKIFLDLDKNRNVRAVVLQAEGKSFCAGVDLNYMKSMIDASYEENLKDADQLGNLFKAIYDCSKPVIGKINGSAFGGGVGLISVCDIAVSVESAVFSLSETKLGLVPGVISPFVIKKIGSSNANRLFITSEKFTSSFAHKIDLLSDVALDVEDLGGKVNSIVDMILQNGPHAVSLSKQLVRDVSESDFNTAILKSKEYIARCRASKEGQEGMSAFLEKRKPNWIK